MTPLSIEEARRIQEEAKAKKRKLSGEEVEYATAWDEVAAPPKYEDLVGSWQRRLRLFARRLMGR